ncbi:hypothetical protein [Streptomyces sp. NPDC004232]
MDVAGLLTVVVFFWLRRPTPAGRGVLDVLTQPASGVRGVGR